MVASTKPVPAELEAPHAARAPAALDGAHGQGGRGASAKDPSPTGAAVDGGAPAPMPESKPRPSKGRVVVLGVLLLVAGSVGGYLWSRRNLESTDNAQIDGEVIAVPARATGTVAKVLFVENQAVKQGDLLALVDDAPAKAKVRQAEARLLAAQAAADAAFAETQVSETNAKGNKAVASAALTTASMGAATASDQIKEAESQVKSSEVQLKQAETDHERAQSLFDSGAITKVQLDQSVTALDLARSTAEGAKARLATLQLSRAQAESRVVEASAKADQTSDISAVVAQAKARARAASADIETAKAALDLANLDVTYTEIRAPADGIMSKKSISEGQAIATGQPVGELVTEGIWVSANFKETQIHKMRQGQPAEIDVDAFPGVKLKGEVESFAGATGSKFTLLPPDNASGNFTKIVQRMPIRIKLKDLPSDVALRPGMSVELTVDTR